MYEIAEEQKINIIVKDKGELTNVRFKKCKEQLQKELHKLQ